MKGDRILKSVISNCMVPQPGVKFQLPNCYKFRDPDHCHFRDFFLSGPKALFAP